MSGRDASVEARSRFLKAVAVVCVLILLVPTVDSAIRFATRGQAAGALDTAERGIDSEALLDVTDAFGSLERIESVAQGTDVAVPEPFSSEIGLLPGARDIRASPQGDVVGYLVDGGSGEVLGEVSRYMEERGWTVVPLGGVQGATFVKSVGECTWALVTCTQVGAGTAVVVRVVTS